MVTRLSNYDVLDGWLGYLQETVGRLVGTSKEKIMETVARQNLLQSDQFFCLECPLLGEPGADFALQYETKDFLKNREFAGGTGFRYAHFFKLYGEIVGPHKNFFLEVDTATGRGDTAAVFLNVLDTDVQKVVAKTLAFLAETKRIARMQELLDLAQEHELVPVHLGFMYSRYNGPLRLTFGIPLEVLLLPDRYDGFARYVQILELGKQSAALRKAIAKNPELLMQLTNCDLLLDDLTELAAFDFLDCFLDVDIMPDGSIGDVVGIEIMPCVHSLKSQQEMLRSQEFANFIFFLQKLEVMDDRFLCFADCIFYAELPQALGEQEYLFSMLSHFKLRYKNGKRLPAKVYLQGNRGK